MERCDGEFTQNNKESYNKLIGKITPKMVPCGSKIVKIAANIAAGVFNEDTSSLLYYMYAIGVSFRANAYECAQKENEERVTISHRRAQEATREERMARRQHRIEFLEAAEGMEGL